MGAARYRRGERRSDDDGTTRGGREKLRRPRRHGDQSLRHILLVRCGAGDFTQSWAPRGNQQRSRKVRSCRSGRLLCQQSGPSWSRSGCRHRGRSAPDHLQRGVSRLGRHRDGARAFGHDGRDCRKAPRGRSAGRGRRRAHRALRGGRRSGEICGIPVLTSRQRHHGASPLNLRRVDGICRVR